IDDSAEVHAQSTIPAVEVRVFRITTPANTCVIAEHVDLAESSDGLLGGMAQLVAISYVRLHDLHVSAATERLLRFSQIVRIEVYDHHLHAELQEALCHGLTD